MLPIALSANQPPDRFYAGGEQIAGFRGLAESRPHTPEDWVASTTCQYGLCPVGLSALPDGRLLRDAVEAEPQLWLGEVHHTAYGTDTRILVKLLDAGQRLPIHAHPDDRFAAEHCGTAHGKAEAWYCLTAGTMHLGLRTDVDPATLGRMVAEQDTDTLLGLMHAVEVEAGDTVYVPPGLLHAVGKGILLVEVQQPEDLSILLEWRGFALDGARDGHLDLGFDLALRAVEHTARNRADIDALVLRQVLDGPALVPASLEFFRMDVVSSPAAVAAGFGVAIVVDGETTLAGEPGSVTFPRGTTAVVPFSFGDYRVSGGRLVLSRPPEPR